MTKLGGWGMFPTVDANLKSPSSESDVKQIISDLGNVIPRGAGRSYGDPALNAEIFQTASLDQTLGFDVETGIFTCEAGKKLSDILGEVVPKGFFLPVTPGTKFVTVGGAIAADIHGKNHHKDGCFSEHVISFSMMLADGTVITCNRTENTNIFWATCGGMGLTGVILSASFKLKPIETHRIVNRTIKCENLNEVVSNLLQHESYTYSVAWIDCDSSGTNLGRSLLYLGEHASKEDAPNADLNTYSVPKPIITLPFNLPTWTLNNLTVKAFNALYYGKVFKKDATAIVDIEPYFYPLDVLGKWNRLYGKKGFIQYQFVLPLEYANDGLTEIMKTIAKSGQSSFLAVLKLFGEENQGWLSFPKRGIQLALDFRANSQSLKLMDRLDEMILEMNGRWYLAKDSRMKAETFATGYPKLEHFKKLKKEIDPQCKFRSLQSDRLGIT